MKVKKPQSKRKSTRLQKGIQKKVAAHNRKERKLGKKNVTWKSRIKKDIGIPNSYVFKNELLEEIEQKRQQELEARQARREQLRAEALVHGSTEAEIAQLEQQQDIVENQDRLSALLQSAQDAADEFAGFNDNEEDASMSSGSEMDEEESQVMAGVEEAFAEIRSDTSRKAFDKYFKQVVDLCDVIIYVLDARNPDGTRSKQVEQTLLSNPGKRLIFVLNKIDLVPTDVLQKWVKHLQLSFPTIAMNASPAAANAITFDHKGLSRTNTALKLLESLKAYSRKASASKSITVGVVGFPNVGKSSIINSLLSRHGEQRNACTVGAQAGVTTELRRIRIDKQLTVLDSPGIVFPSAVNSGKKKLSEVEEHARLILLNVVSPRRMDDCRPAVARLVKRLKKRPDQWLHFCEYYNLPAIPEGTLDKFITGILIHVSRKLGRIGKGGIPDLGSAAQAIIMDWRDGRIKGWAEPPAEPQATPQNVEVVSAWSKELDLDSILGNLLDSNA